MAEKTLPDFKDEKAKKKTTEYKSFNGKLVEILYGAKDEDGNPIEPMADKQDGHGRWFGIESNGEYTMFSWQKPASEGGEIEYGTSHEDHALEDLRAEMEKKAEICREAETLNEGDEEAFQAVKDKWNATENWGTAKDIELEERFNNAISKFSANSERAAANRKEKEEIVSKARELLNLENFKQAGNQLRELINAFNDVGSAGKLADDELWSQMREIRKTLDQKRKEYFDTLNERQAAAKVKKEELIQKAKETAASVTNFKAAGDQMNAIFAEWKAAGRAGRDVDDDLWAEFNGIRQEFYDKRKAYFEERSAEWQASIAAKKELIEKAKEISAAGDYSKDATEAMKQLDRDYKAAGYSGKEQNDALWKEFSEAKEVFWDAKRDQAVERFKNALAKKEERVKEIAKEIDDSKFKVEITPSLDAKHEIEREIDRKQRMIDRLNGEIEDLQRKIDN